MPPKPTTSSSQVASTPATKVTYTYIETFDPSKYTNANRTAEDVLKLKEVFDLFDYDHSGQISI